jgi:glycerol uptake facilitator-like aquaporin
VAFLSRAEVSAGSAIAYVGAQILGAVLGTWLAHAMFNETLFQVSLHDRQGAGLWLAEAVATFGLVLTIFGTLRWKPEATPLTVGLYITSAYWFTASTSFANPAVTIARSLTNTFAGIGPRGVPPFVVAQLLGAIAAAGLSLWLLRKT